MASLGMLPPSGLRDHSENAGAVDRLPNEINDMKIRDDKVNLNYPIFFVLILIICYRRVFPITDQDHDFASQEVEATVVDGNGAEAGHIIVTTIGGKNGQPKQVNEVKQIPVFNV